MHVERDTSGDFILESPEIASRFGVPGEEFRRRLRQGHVASTVERGEGEDAGTHRLTVRLGNRMWRAILNSDDEVLQENLTFIRNPLRAPVPRSGT